MNTTSHFIIPSILSKIATSQQPVPSRQLPEASTHAPVAINPYPLN